MKKGLSSEFMYQLFALLTAIILVHAVYVAVIRPSADEQLAAEAAAQQAGEDVVPKRSLAVVVRDYEQEACFVLMLWALAILLGVPLLLLSNDPRKVAGMYRQQLALLWAGVRAAAQRA